MPGWSGLLGLMVATSKTRFAFSAMEADGVFLIDAESFKQIDFIPTARGAHGLYPSRDGKKLYVTNRGTHMVKLGVERGEAERLIEGHMGRLRDLLGDPPNVGAE